MPTKLSNGLDLQGQKIINLASPSSSTDAANMAYVDLVAAGLVFKPAVRVASTANITVASPGTTIDGVTMASGNRVLLKNQTSGAENGTYLWNGASSPMTRTTDVLSAGSVCDINEGSVNADTFYMLTTDNPITVGTTVQTWGIYRNGLSYTGSNGVLISGASITAVADTGILVSSSGIAIDTSIVPKKYTVAIGNGSSTSIAVTHNLNTKDVICGLRTVSDDSMVMSDWVATSVNVVTFTFAAAPSASQYRATVIG